MNVWQWVLTLWEKLFPPKSRFIPSAPFQSVQDTPRGSAAPRPSRKKQKPNSRRRRYRHERKLRNRVAHHSRAFNRGVKV